MAEWIDLDRVLDIFVELIQEFEQIVQESPASELIERISRWKARVSAFLGRTFGTEEARKFDRISLKFDPYVSDSFNAMLTSHRNALVILAEEVARHPNQFFTRDTFVASQPKVQHVFISHAAADRKLAEYLRDELVKRRPGTEFFLSSRPGHIRTGHEWWQTIQQQLRSADAYIVLLTPISIGRPWIPFETGAAWMTNRLLLTVSAGLDKTALPNPLAFFQVNSLEVPDEAEAFLTDLGATTDEVTTMCEAVRDLIAASAQEQLSAEGWVGVAVGSRYFAWDGPALHTFPERPPIPTPAGLLDAIREAGFTPSYGTRDKLTRHLAAGRLQVFETDKRSFQRPVLGGGSGEDQILLVRSSSVE